MKPRTRSKPVENKENSASSQPSKVSGYIDVNAYLASQPNSNNNGYIRPGSHESYPLLSAAPGVNHGYVSAPPVMKSMNGSAENYAMSAKDKCRAAIRTEENRLCQLREEAVNAYNSEINARLQENGFINRVDIKKGITACIAVFEYVGNDEKIKAISKHGYIMVKIPPYTSAANNIHIVGSEYENEGYVGVQLPQQTSAQNHAELTYNNEFNIISQMHPISLDKTRPDVLAVEFQGQSEFEKQKFILNSPVFFDETEFLRARASILNGEHLELFSDSDASHEEGDDHVKSIKQFAMNGLLGQAFLNLSCLIRRLVLMDENPVKSINTYFSSILIALNKLHNDGILHGDIAGRNIVPRIDRTVALVDFGTADFINRVNGKARANIKYPHSSVMYNHDALKAEDHIIGVITDYISFQKTLLQAIADLLNVDFFKSILQNLPDAPATINVAYLVQFTDRQILDNVKNNLMATAEEMYRAGDIRGEYGLALLNQYEPYFNHDHNPKHTFAQLQEANHTNFKKCARSAYVMKPREQTAEKLSAYEDHIVVQNSNQPPAPRPVSRTNTAIKIGLFNGSQANLPAASAPLAGSNFKKL